MNVPEFLVATGLSTVVSGGAVFFLFRRFMEIQVQKAINQHKDGLDRRASQLKTDLDIYAHERTVGLTRLDELRAAAIQELYAIAMRWHELFIDITQPELPMHPVPNLQITRMIDWIDRLALIADELSVKVRDTAIFFDEESYRVVASFGQAAARLSLDFRAASKDQWDMTRDPVYDELVANFEAARAALRDAYGDEFKNASDALVREFRRLMRAERVVRPPA